MGFQTNTNVNARYRYSYFSFLYRGETGAAGGELFGLQDIASTNYDPTLSVTLNNPTSGVWSFDILNTIDSDENQNTVEIEVITSSNSLYQMSFNFVPTVV